MTNGAGECAQTEDFDNEDATFETLPTELFLHICSFLDAKFVIKTLSSVCKYFHSVINDDVFWRVRIGKRWPKKYPAIPVLDFDWKEACIAREEQFNLWRNSAQNMTRFRYTEGMFASVDAVHLMQNGELLAAGSRDRYLNLVDVRKLDPADTDSVKEAKVFSKMNAHQGWIWSISSLGSSLATGSWDTKIKFWDLAAGAQLENTVKTKSAILCTHYEPGLLMAGSYDKHLHQVDPRAPGLLASRRVHRAPVLCLAADDRYVVSGSEDKTVAVYDRRADRLLKALVLEEYPMSLSYGRDQLWVGDKAGRLLLLDASDGDFSIVDTYDVGHTGKVTGIVHTPGAIFTCSTDKTIKVLEPSLRPGVITTLQTHTAEVAEITFQNGVLASASSDVSVEIWKPTEE